MHFCSALGVKNILGQEFLDLIVDDAMFHVGSAMVKHEYGKLIHPDSPSSDEVLAHKNKALTVITNRMQESSGILDNTTLVAAIFLPFVDVSRERADST